MSAVLDRAPGLNNTGNMLPTLREIEDAARVVYREFQATPQYRWGLSSQRLGTDVLGQAREPHAGRRLQGARRADLFRALVQRQRRTARRHQRHARQPRPVGRLGRARRHGVACHHRRAARQFAGEERGHARAGRELIEHGDDFQESREFAIRLAAERGAHMVPSFHADLLSGVSTYWWEFMLAVPQLDVVTCPWARARASARQLPPSSH
jgi:threonine dehydratase